MHDIVIGHSFMLKGQKSFTIQLIMNFPTSPDNSLPQSVITDYGVACNRLLDTLWATSKTNDEDIYIFAISESLVLLVGAFIAISSVSDIPF